MFITFNRIDVSLNMFKHICLIKLVVEVVKGW